MPGVGTMHCHRPSAQCIATGRHTTFIIKGLSLHARLLFSKFIYEKLDMLARITYCVQHLAILRAVVVGGIVVGLTKLLNHPRPGDAAKQCRQALSCDVSHENTG